MESESCAKFSAHKLSLVLHMAYPDYTAPALMPIRLVGAVYVSEMQRMVAPAIWIIAFHFQRAFDSFVEIENRYRTQPFNLNGYSSVLAYVEFLVCHNANVMKCY